jgi:hypothetical protein
MHVSQVAHRRYIRMQQDTRLALVQLKLRKDTVVIKVWWSTEAIVVTRYDC